MKIIDHWLDEACRSPSPNYNARPVGAVPELIVIHNISLPPDQFGGGYIERFFLNQLPVKDHPYFEEIHTLQVSSHLLIQRDGKIVQFVGFEQRAWHAGQSCFQGRENCNDFSIGIELEGSDFQAFDARQYAMLNRVMDCLMAAYPNLSMDRIVGHSDIAPGRKTDPGPYFDWSQIGCAPAKV